MSVITENLLFVIDDQLATVSRFDRCEAEEILKGRQRREALCSLLGVTNSDPDESLESALARTIREADAATTWSEASGPTVTVASPAVSVDRFGFPRVCGFLTDEAGMMSGLFGSLRATFHTIIEFRTAKSHDRDVRTEPLYQLSHQFRSTMMTH